MLEGLLDSAMTICSRPLRALACCSSWPQAMATPHGCVQERPCCSSNNEAFMAALSAAEGSVSLPQPVRQCSAQPVTMGQLSDLDVRDCTGDASACISSMKFGTDVQQASAEDSAAHKTLQQNEHSHAGQSEAPAAVADFTFPRLDLPQQHKA